MPAGCICLHIDSCIMAHGLVCLRALRLCVQVLQFEQQYLDALPNAQMYEKSYMHRDTVTHIVVRTDPRSSSCHAYKQQAAQHMERHPSLAGTHADMQHAAPNRCRRRGSTAAAS
jgi:hypothetical protein